MGTPEGQTKKNKKKRGVSPPDRFVPFVDPGPSKPFRQERPMKREKKERTELLHDRLQLLEVSLVLALLLNLDLDALDSSDGSGEVVASSGGSDHGLDHVDRGDEVVGEAVVHASLF